MGSGPKLHVHLTLQAPPLCQLSGLESRVSSQSCWLHRKVIITPQIQPAVTVQHTLSRLLSAASTDLLMNAWHLFGGALESAGLPVTFKDISSLRQVPDNQEVFADEASESSFIVEILAHDRGISDEAAAAYYFNDMATANEVFLCTQCSAQCNAAF